jgi:hypothetical protein
MSNFQYPWLLGKEEKKITSLRGRWIDREFGFEYTAFERNQIEAFSKANRDELVEIYGFVSWIDRTKFLLLPTRTTNSIYIICEGIEGLDFPPNNQYVSCKGKWEYDGTLKSLYKKLIVEDVRLDTPDYKKFRSDIKPSEFQGNLFENWSNIDPIQENFLTQYFISSPSLPSRVGGITVSMFNPPRQTMLVRRLNADLRRSIAPELLGTKKMIFDIPELNKKHRLLPFDWNEEISDFEKIPQNTQELLNRKTSTNNLEQSISLLSKKHQPNNFDSFGLVKSDYPIVIEEHVERKNHSPYADLKMTQFIVASHMNTPSIEQKTYDESLIHVRKELKKFVDTKTHLATKLLGHEKMLDLDFNGKPTSILNLAVSQQRISNTDIVDKNKVISATKDYVKNLDIVFRVWDDRTAGGKIHPLARLSFDEEKVLVFLHKYGPHTFEEICKATELSHDRGRKVIDDLYNMKNAIYMHSKNKYDAISS